MSDVTEIDQQHRQLVNMLNELNEAVKNHVERKDIYHIIDEIILFTESHFANEEYMMAQAGYPEIELHKEKHKQLVKEALRLKDKLDNVGEEMFREWFNHWPFANVLAHIQYADKQIIDYITQVNLKR
jgi:hemerythrin